MAGLYAAYVLIRCYLNPSLAPLPSAEEIAKDDARNINYAKALFLPGLTVAIVLLTMPIFVPIITGLGLDPIWFGVVFCLNMQVSLLSPPFGPAAFYLKSVAPKEISLGEIFSALTPFIGLQILALALVIFFPELALWWK